MNPRTRRQRRKARNRRKYVVSWRFHAVTYACSSKPWRGAYEGSESRARRVTRRTKAAAWAWKQKP